MFRGLLLASTLGMLISCAAEPEPMPPVDYVDLPRFMGKWFVIASIPTFLEKGAHNAVEDYSLNEDGTVSITFEFRKGAFDGKRKQHSLKGFINDKGTNALWTMQLFWPLRADYRVVYLDDQYQNTIIGQLGRDHVYVMSRSPDISDAEYQVLVNKVQSLGYAVGELKRIPHQWSAVQ